MKKTQQVIRGIAAVAIMSVSCSASMVSTGLLRHMGTPAVPLAMIAILAGAALSFAALTVFRHPKPMGVVIAVGFGNAVGALFIAYFWSMVESLR